MTQYRTRARAVGAALAPAALAAVLAVPGWSIELGAARLKSAADAPLEVEIPLLDAAPDELVALNPQLPSNARSPELGAATIELGQGGNGEPVLRVRTAQPVTARELRFVVVADWGRGRRFREYTISLASPPAPAAEVPAPAAPPAAPAAAPPEAPVPPAVTTFSTSRADSANESAAAQDPPVGRASPPPASGLRTTRVVRSDETLMSISREWSARTGATLAQTMIGIFEANPQAFGPRGMNELLVGAEIALPEAATLTSTSPTEASSEVSRALGIWRTGSSSTPPAAAPAPAARAPAAPAPAARAPAAPAPSAPQHARTQLAYFLRPRQQALPPERERNSRTSFGLGSKA